MTAERRRDGRRAFGARYNDGRRARTADVMVVADVGGLSLHDAAGVQIARWDAAGLRLVDDAGGAGEARIAYGGPDSAERLVFPSYELTNLRADFGLLRRRRRIHGKALAHGIGWTATGIGALAGLFFFAVPAFAVAMARVLPAEWERAFGEVLADNVAQVLSNGRDRPFCDGAAGQAALDALTARLLAGAEDAPEGVVVLVVRSDMVNALALPGGQVLILEELLTFVDGPNELAAVLAHELGHVALRHPTENAFKAAATGYLAGLLVGDVAGGGAIVAATQQLTAASYGREAEREADAFAVGTLNAAGVDSRPMATVFDKFAKEFDEEESAVPSLLATHPPSVERAAAARNRAQDGAEALTKAEWRDLKAICS